MNDYFVVKGTIVMKILPSDDLSHKSDYNINYKKYFNEELIDSASTQSTISLLSPLIRTFLQRLVLTTRIFKL